MIDNVKKDGDHSFIINDSVRITINEDISVTAEFDESNMTDDEVNLLIDELFKKIL